MQRDFSLKTIGTGVIDFLAALTKPLQTMTDALHDFEVEYLARAKFNSQKMVLQAALNYIFENPEPLPQILIETNDGITPVIFYEPEELQTVDFFEAHEMNPTVFYEDTETPTVATYDFTVKIPVLLHSAELERRVRAEVTLYKLTGKTFNIITY